MRTLALLLVFAIQGLPIVSLAQSSYSDELILAFEVRPPQRLQEIHEYVAAIPGVHVAGVINPMNMLLIRLDDTNALSRNQLMQLLIAKNFHFIIKEGTVEDVMMQLGESITSHATPSDTEERNR
jgi:hypothetical protein